MGGFLMREKAFIERNQTETKLLKGFLKMRTP